uniref:Dynein heavy chain tail domain-containing protein n=1 Tax=Denticeps clupeoides TaxID=299321 RepID=A0AAY3ZYX4_9TELE
LVQLPCVPLRAIKQLNSQDILRGDTLENLTQVRTALDYLEHIKMVFEEHRGCLSQYQTGDRQVKPWAFPTKMVFAELDRFVQRLQTVERILQTVVELKRLKKMEFSGVKGRTHTQIAQLLHQDFTETFSVFCEKTSDCLDVSNKDFEVDACCFLQKVENAERSLGAVFEQAFNLASGLEQAFKVLEMFGTLLARPMVACKAREKYPILIRMFSAEMDTCLQLFRERMQLEEQPGYAAVSKNMPAVSGGLKWAQQLQERIHISFNNFRFVSDPCMEAGEAKETFQKYEEIENLLKR